MIAILHSRTATLLLFGLIVGPSWASNDPDATIISLHGSGNYREQTGSNWQPASVNKALVTGNQVRTEHQSRMALLFKDRTQLRLHQDTVLQIMGVGSDSSNTRLKLDHGRVWAQSKTLIQGLKMETPTATAAIRGTDWELAVEDDGTSQITVLSGVVEFSNEQGSVTVNKNEQARAQKGKAPVKVLVINPRERVQWVSSYSIDPLRHINFDKAGKSTKDSRAADEVFGLMNQSRFSEASNIFEKSLKDKTDIKRARLGMGFVKLHEHDFDEAKRYFDQVQGQLESAEQTLLQLGLISCLIYTENLPEAQRGLEKLIQKESSLSAGYLILSDLQVYGGDLKGALLTLEQGLKKSDDHARINSHFASLLLLDDKIPESHQRLSDAFSDDPYSYEAQLAQGNLARLEGETRPALQAFGKAREIRPDDDRGWFGLGRVLTEREAVHPAEKNLNQAIAINPNVPDYYGELGTLMTFADNQAAAQEAYQQALALAPDDYTALTGRGILLLKQGKPAEALKDFLAAGVMEPQFSRAHFYTAIAYYQLGLTKQALEELSRASELDDKDPLPHLLASVIYQDQFMARDSVESSQQALARMPYLKSLNQVANDQQGSANLGRSIAFFGMEEWANHQAQESYYPYWAGSPLFLADRYTGLFNKNSMLMQGFITDPVVFGAANRFHSLIPQPGLYLDGGYRYAYLDQPNSSNDQSLAMPYIKINGYDNNIVPASIFLSYEPLTAKPKSKNSPLGKQDGATSSEAVGVKLRHDLGLFLFASQSDMTTKVYASPSFYFPTWKDGKDRVDVGLHYKLMPDNQVWLKAGKGKDTTYIPTGTLTSPSSSITNMNLDYQLNNDDISLRHLFQLDDRWQLSWGAEQATQDRALTIKGLFNFPPAYDIVESETLTSTSSDYYLSTLWRDQAFTLDAGMFYQQHKIDQHNVTDFVGIIAFPEDIPLLDEQQFNPRFGVAYQPSPPLTVRAAYQKWMRPASTSTLAPVATAGIPLDDRIVGNGGQLTRMRGQVEWQATPEIFTQAFVDHRKIDNIVQNFFFVPVNENLGGLKERNMASLATDDMYEFVSPPDFAEGTAQSAGAALNMMLTRTWSAYLRYIHTASRNTSIAMKDKKLPLLAENTAALGLTWVSPWRIYFISRITYRGDRFGDEANLVKVKSGKDINLDAFWETRDKHWLVRFGYDNMLIDNGTTTLYSTDVNFRY